MPKVGNIKIMPVVEYARAHTADMVQILVDLAFHAEKEAVRAYCAKTVLDRGWGTAPQQIQVTGETPKSLDLSSLNQEQLRELHRLVTLVRPPDEVIDKEDMSDESKLKNVTAIVPIKPEEPNAATGE